MTFSSPLSLSTRALLVVGMLVIGLVFEYLRPLRKSTQPKVHRVIVNLGLAAMGALVLRFTFFPIVFAVSAWTTTNQRGLLPLLQLPSTIALIVALLALDYTLYIWHWMNHRIPFLWRFHNVHHVDLDLDVSTASRFHFGELILSSGFRSAQVFLIGIDPVTLILFETLITTSAQFHHSNVRLPFKFERLLNLAIVTPRMHGIHHSIVQEETDSNFSAILSAWDRIHKTLRLGISQTELTIGVAAYREPREVGFFQSLILPGRKPRPWRLPDGSVPTRHQE